MSAGSHKKTILLVALAFLVPVLLAKLALEQDWFNKASTNKGQLLNPPLDLSVLDGTQRWRLLYILPEDCDKACENALISINQVWMALGREQDRAEPVVIATEVSDDRPAEHLQQFPNIRLLTSSQQVVKQVFKDVPTDGIFLVDTMNNVILKYPLQQEQQQAVLHSRDILADLRKLLKLSRIG
ncbi:hypothetical protein [Bowmanella dokdonensis]|uniref:Uncharacterized protein n=1 Tax=Bowmanella dokdonensis TaxID=751969 RepID=A0A939DK25_9ALTE|nr:hypothetical protein [Bowmanella dokdonensis]MBN7823615.1 hypothetical protein [Bowmanella dokdonensis]